MSVGSARAFGPSELGSLSAARRYACSCTLLVGGIRLLYWAHSMRCVSLADAWALPVNTYLPCRRQRPQRCCLLCVQGGAGVVDTHVPCRRQRPHRCCLLCVQGGAGVAGRPSEAAGALEAANFNGPPARQRTRAVTPPAQRPPCRGVPPEVPGQLVVAMPPLLVYALLSGPLPVLGLGGVWPLNLFFFCSFSSSLFVLSCGLFLWASLGSFQSIAAALRAPAPTAGTIPRQPSQS